MAVLTTARIEVIIAEGLGDERMDAIFDEHADDMEAFLDLFFSRLATELQKAYPGIPGLKIVSDIG